MNRKVLKWKVFVSLMFKFLTVTCQLKDSNQRLIPGVMRPYSEICMNAVLLCYILTWGRLAIVHCLVIYYLIWCTGYWPIKIFISHESLIKHQCFVFCWKLNECVAYNIIFHSWHISSFKLVRIIVVDFVSELKRNIISQNVFSQLTSRTAT